MWIDVHQHYLPMPPAPSDAWQASLYHASRVQGYADVAQTLAAMDDVGVTRCVWQGEYFLHQHDCEARNRRVAAAVATNPQRLGAFAIVQPNHADAMAELERCREVGFLGIGELNPAAQQFSLHSRAFLHIAEYCARWQWPMLIHVNEPVGNDYPGKVSLPLVDIYELAARFPELPLILAHWGGGLWWYEHIPAVRRVLANVYYDSAASFHTYPDTTCVIRQALEVVPDKIMFGSDFPLKRPRQSVATLHEYSAAFHTACTVDQLTACLGGTALRLLTHKRNESPLTTMPALRTVTLETPIRALVEQYPATAVVCATWHIHIDEHTPWWLSVRGAASAAGVFPDRWQHLVRDLQHAVSFYADMRDHPAP